MLLYRADLVLVAPAAQFDVARAMAAYRGHSYPGSDSDMIKPFDSEDETRQFLAPFAAGDSSAG